MRRKKLSRRSHLMLMGLLLLFVPWFAALGEWDGVALMTVACLLFLPGALPGVWEAVRHRIRLTLSQAQQLAVSTALIVVPFGVWQVLKYGLGGAIGFAVIFTLSLLWIAMLVVKQGWSGERRREE